MFIWKYLEMPEWDQIQLELKHYVNNIKTVDVREPTATDSTRLFYLNNQEIFRECPVFLSYFQRVGLADREFVIIKYSFPTEYNHKPHLDNSSYYNLSEDIPGKPTSWCLGLNFPVENCEDTYTAFYSPKDGEVIISKVISRPDKPHWGVYREIEVNNLVEIDRYCLNRPILINTSVPHNVINRSGKTRVAITVRIRPDPWCLI